MQNRGKTLSFLSADKTVRVMVDDRIVYTFGITDTRLFGHTPGSIMVFADIPQEYETREIEIQMVSPLSRNAVRKLKSY
jgi:hypothetical protein